MKLLPIPEKFVTQLKELGVKKLVLEFWCDTDAEVYLEISIKGVSDLHVPTKLLHAVEDWADEAYDYEARSTENGYGDDVTYNFTNNAITRTSWCMVRTVQLNEYATMEIE